MKRFLTFIVFLPVLAYGQLSIDTSQVTLVSTDTLNGNLVRYYENQAYTCSRSGYHSFVILQKGSFAPQSEQPLWILMHGGGIGYWNTDSTIAGNQADLFVDGEPRDSLISYSRFVNPGGGLIEWAKNYTPRFRFLIPSMCDHDMYSGIGAVDRFNPNNPDENGNKRRVDGLLALRSALKYTVGRYNTSHIVAHGMSSGSVGALSLGISLGNEGKCLSAIVMDAGVMSRIMAQLHEMK